MDRDGVDVDVIYGPTDSLPVADMELRRACYSAYNDWLVDFQSYDPKRLVGVGQLSWEDPEFSKLELLRAAKKGIKHFNIAAVHCNPPVYAPEWEPFWDVAEDSGIPIGFHLVVEVRRFSRRGPGGDQEKPYDPFVMSATNSAKTATGMQIVEPVTGLIYRGILDRHPKLKIVMAESGLSWIPNMMESLDVIYRRAAEGRRPAGFPEKMPELLPSEYWARQIWMTFQDDAIGLKCLDALNVDRVMWANDYPHPASTWPRSQQVIERNFKGIAPEVRQKILVDNAQQLYDL
jgi:predicted TIM-barrel fold metal-dependent hydrolase